MAQLPLARRVELLEQLRGLPAQAFPVGAVFLSIVSTDPSELLGYGTWAQIAQGRAIVGVNAADVDFDAAEKTGGAKTHTLTIAEMPAHSHVQDPHTHVQNAHSHGQQIVNTGTAGAAGAQGSDVANNASAGVTDAATAVNQNATATNQNTGGGGAHNNLQPFFVVYVWKRTG